MISYNEILPIFLHELNHIKRGQLFSAEQQPTLFNWMPLEGLAGAFERYSCKTSSLLSTKPNQEILQCGLKQILKINNSNNWNYDDWFYNFDQRSSYPINYAYHIGEWLVNSFCQARQILPSQAVEIAPEVFWKFAEDLCA